jgi:cellulose synthase/poly-beta-1,6-N-acetylglucosamine synthase-like glycosyltransferase
MTAANWALLTSIIVVTVPAVLASLYLLAATLLSGEMATAEKPPRTLRFDVIVPAHNEAQVIARTLDSLRALDWPADRFRLLVVADNCDDATATIAGACGAQVIERNDAQRRGKGYALSYAFAISHRDKLADAVVVVDADSVVSANLLAALAARIVQGADAVQVHYGVLNAQAGWRTRLIAIAMAAIHKVRSRARERLRLSCGIRGNGWCVTHALLQRVPYRAFSLAEDVEFGLDLGMQGYRVNYADEAYVNGEMVTNARSAGSQRQRWERGRYLLMRTRTLGLLRAAVARRSRICLDLALDLLVAPLSYVALNVIALALLAALGGLLYPPLHSALWVAAGCAISIFLYVLRGWQLSGVGWRGLIDLLWVPVFIVWKILVAWRGRRSVDWIRTDRESS